jgi:hypothetical protein
MRDVVAVGVRAIVFAVLGLMLRTDPVAAVPPESAGAGGLFLLLALAALALLWGLVDGLLTAGTITRTMLRWAAVAPFTTVLLALGGGVVHGAWPEAADAARWLAGLTALLYFVQVLPAGLGVVLGAGAQGLDDRRSRRAWRRGGVTRRS